MLGCAIALTAAVFLGIVVSGFVVFLESGSSTGRVTLDPLGAYPPGTMQRFPEDGFYLVRLLDGTTFALSDLDAANRAATGQRCRVEPLIRAEPALAEALEDYARRFSPGTEESTLVFREVCFGALYDAAGIRLDRDDRNLDRFAVDLDEQGNVIVETSERTCTRREETDVEVEVDC
jgi:hypothetical protein